MGKFWGATGGGEVKILHKGLQSLKVELKKNDLFLTVLAMWRTKGHM